MIVKNYTILWDDFDYTHVDSYAEAVNFVMIRYKEVQRQGFIVTPIINGKFTYYKSGDDGDDGITVEIVRTEDLFEVKGE